MEPLRGERHAARLSEGEPHGHAATPATGSQHAAAAAPLGTAAASVCAAGEVGAADSSGNNGARVT